MSGVEPATSKTNPVLLEPVQTKQPEPIVLPPSTTVDEESTAAEIVGLVEQHKEETTIVVKETTQLTSIVSEDIKPNPSPFGFELPVLRSVSATQLPPPIVRQEPELVLPTLRPVPVAEPTENINVESSPLQWELPPLDSRPNLQALLEREKRAAEAAVNNQVLKQHQEEQLRKQQEEQLRKQQQEEQLRKLQEEQHRKQQQELQLRKQQEEQQKAMMQQLEQQKQQQLKLMHQQQKQKQQQQQILMNEELRMVQEAQLAKLSVRLKVQRFETTGPPPMNYVGHVTVSQSSSPRLSGISSPTQPILTGRNKPEYAPYVPPMSKPIDIRPVANTKENSAPTGGFLTALSPMSMMPPRMTEQFHQMQFGSLPKSVVIGQSPQAVQHKPAPLHEPFAAVQLRQPSSKF